MNRKKCLSLLLAVCMVLALLPTVAMAEAPVADTLNRAFTGRSGTGYGDWTGTGASGAVYAGKSAGGNDSIQLRTSNNDSGIVTTVSGGKATKIVVKWYSTTTKGRTLDIYGKNSAYTAPTDLYSNSSNTQGTKLGSLEFNKRDTDNKTTLTISGDYEYIGMRSNNGAIFLTSITITWEADGDTPPATTYTVTLNPGDAEGEPQTIEDVTSPYTLPDCPFEAPEGCVFDGWQADNGDVFAAGTEIEITDDTTFTATWKELVARTYELVTSEDELVDGGTYLIASELFVDELYLMSNQTSNNRAQYKVTGVEGTTLTLDESWIATAAADALAFEFTLEDAEDGWAFHDEVTGGYLYAAGNETNKKNWLRTETELDDNGIFIIAYEGDDGATVPVAQGENTRGYMHYNGENNLFSCYAENSHITGAVYLYKLVEDEPVELSNGFYLIGPEWTIDDIDAANKFGANVNAGGEYMLETTLAEGDQIKVVKVDSNVITAWYPDGLDNQYTVDAAHAGDVTVFFRETYNSDWAAFGGYFYIQTDYAITCVSGEHGLISTLAGRAAAGETVTIYVEPEEGYELDTLTVMQGETEIQVTRVSDSEYTFVMPAGDVTVTATFAQPAAEPYFRGHSLVLDGQIGVNFTMVLPAISGVDYATSYMTFDIAHGECTERVDYDPYGASEVRRFACYINAIQMAEPITATFHYTQNGTEKTVEQTYSVMDYIESYEQYKDQFDATTQTMIEALADYGHYVQIFLAEQRGWTLGVDFAEMTKAFTDSYDEAAIEAVRTAVEDYAFQKTLNSDIQRITLSLVLDSEMELRVFFIPVDGYEGTVVADDPYTAMPENGRYRVSVLNVPAHQLSREYAITVTTDAGTASATASALSYVRLMLNAFTSASAQNAAAAIYAYSQAANAYKATH